MRGLRIAVAIGSLLLGPPLLAVPAGDEEVPEEHRDGIAMALDAEVEALVEDSFHSLVWMDPETLVLNPPEALDLLDLEALRQAAPQHESTTLAELGRYAASNLLAADQPGRDQRVLGL